jgi:predicted nucleotidyltransferase
MLNLPALGLAAGARGSKPDPGHEAGLSFEVSASGRRPPAGKMKNNGYVLEQIFSPLVVLGREYLDRLRPVAISCISRRLVHHYRGFLHTQLGLMEKESPKRAKTLLYAYRVVLTGIHVLRTGEIEASLPALNRPASLPGIEELIGRKREAGEAAVISEGDLSAHRATLARLEEELEVAAAGSPLPPDVDPEPVHDFLIEERLRGLPGGPN